MRMVTMPTPFTNLLGQEISDEPDIYFITLNKQVDEGRLQMRKYLFNKPDASIYNFEKVYGDVITNTNIDPIFLFSEDDGNNIKNIIGDSKYSSGL